MCACVCMRVCVCVCVKGILFVILKYLSFQLSFLFEIEARLVYCQYNPVSVFWAWEGPFLFPTKILVPWKPQEEYVRAKCQRIAQPHINPRKISFFTCWGYGRINQKKACKTDLGEPETTVHYGHKNDLN